jgi:predicted RNA-binding Zn-ribbon protein involved in translation (DUF1610 family)
VGVHIQAVGDLEAAGQEARALGLRVVDFLLSEDIVRPAGNAIGSYDYVAGANWALALEAPPPTERHTGLRQDAAFLDVEFGRQVFWAPCDAMSVRCPGCGTVVHLRGGTGENPAWRHLSAVIDEWVDGGDGEYPCPECGRRLVLNDWLWSPRWGFGHLGLTFTDWPPLGARFLSKLTELLGHEPIYQAYKM